MQTFKKPLTPKRTDFALHGIFADKGFREMAESYRKKLGGNPFGIKPDPPAKPLQPCTITGCLAVYDPNSGTWSPGCTGVCCSC